MAEEAQKPMLSESAGIKAEASASAPAPGGSATATPAANEEDGGAKGKVAFPWGAPPKHPDMPFNPFLNHSVPFSSPWEVARAFLLFPLVLFRILVVIFVFSVGFFWSHVVLIGAKDIFTKPFPLWRRNLLFVLSPFVRLLLWAMGYNWIHVKGKPAPREVAPILVSNHVTSIEPIYFFLRHLPMIVTAKENLKLPVAGVAMKALQVVIVDRASPTSRRDAAAEIKRRAMCNDWPRVMLFPEATTTNGRALVSFKTGAFTPGLPVQPVVVKYPHTNIDPSWVADGMPTPTLFFRLMCCLNNEMSVEYLDPIFPTLAEQKDARLYAERCRLVMAKALNVNVTEHAFGDVALALEAQKLKMPRGVGNIEFGRFERLFRLTLPEAKDYLRRFKQLDLTRSGVVSYNEFLEVLDFPDTDFTRTVFDLFDSNERGKINFRDFVAGLAFLSRHPQFQDSVKSMFGQLDQDSDGKLSVEDVKRGLPKIFPSLSPSQLDNLFRTLGMDKKDYLTWDEFCKFLQSRPEYLALTLASQASLSQDAL